MNTNLKRVSLILIVSAISIISFQNCSKTQFSKAEETSTSPNIVTGLVEPSLYQDKAIQFEVTETQNSKIDILFVIDNSNSMAREQAQIAQVFSGFISKLSHLDWRIAITTTDNSGVYEGSKGTLLPFLNGKYYIDSQTTDVNALFMNRVQTGITGSPVETGLYSIKNFLNSAETSGSKENEFARFDASFSTIVVTDSDQGHQTRHLINTADFVNFVKSKIPDKNYIHHSSIVLPNDIQCKSQGETFGTSYYDVSLLTGGVTASICDVNYANQFELIAKSIIQKVSEKTLDCDPVDSDNDGVLDIAIKSPSGKDIENYTVLNKIIKFQDNLVDLGLYQINYKCLK